MRYNNLTIRVIITLLLGAVANYGQTKPPQFILKPLFSFGSSGSRVGEFSQPQGIAVDPDGKVYVADTGNNRLQVFSINGEFIRSVGGFGWEREQFNRPMDVSASNGLDVFVADYNNHRIERYDRHLNWISSFYSHEVWNEKLQFGYPISVAISKHGELFIVDRDNNRVLKINSFGEPEISFGDYDWGEGYLKAPGHIALNDNDVIAVSDPEARRVVLLDYFGNFFGAITSATWAEPLGVCWLSSTYLLVTDTGNNKVVACNEKGQILFEFGSTGNQIGSLNHPSDLACFKDRLFVLDTGNNRIQVFKVNGFE